MTNVYLLWELDNYTFQYPHHTLIGLYTDLKKAEEAKRLQESLDIKFNWGFSFYINQGVLE